MEKIEFYKNRTLSERFSASVDFLKQNWKVMYKNILIGALPLAIISGYCAQYYQQAALTNFSSGLTSSDLPFIFLYILTNMLLGIYLQSMPGAVLKRYGEGKLTPSTGWNDLSKSMFSLSGKTFAIYFMIGIVVIAFAFVFSLIFFFLFNEDIAGVFAMIGFVVLILFAVLFAFIPSLSLVLYPAYFSGTGNRQSIKIAFGMGFRNWGNVFVTVLLAAIVLGVIIVIFAIPAAIMPLFFPGEINILTFIFGFLAMLGNILIYPIFFIFIAFQYFSIVESEQGLSLQSQVNEFENL